MSDHDQDRPRDVTDSSASAGGIDVTAAVAVREDGGMRPVVVVVLTDEQGQATGILSPAQARRAGLDLISSAVASVQDAAMRAVLAQTSDGGGGDGPIARSIKDASLAAFEEVFREEGAAAADTPVLVAPKAVEDVGDEAGVGADVATD